MSKAYRFENKWLDIRTDLYACLVVGLDHAFEIRVAISVEGENVTILGLAHGDSLLVSQKLISLVTHVSRRD